MNFVPIQCVLKHKKNWGTQNNSSNPNIQIMEPPHTRLQCTVHLHLWASKTLLLTSRHRSTCVSIYFVYGEKEEGYWSTEFQPQFHNAAGISWFHVTLDQWMGGRVSSCPQKVKFSCAYQVFAMLIEGAAHIFISNLAEVCSVWTITLFNSMLYTSTTKTQESNQVNDFPEVSSKSYRCWIGADFVIVVLWYLLYLM